MIFNIGELVIIKTSKKHPRLPAKLVGLAEIVNIKYPLFKCQILNFGMLHGNTDFWFYEDCLNKIS